MLGEDLSNIDRGDLLLDKLHPALDPGQKLSFLVDKIDYCNILTGRGDMLKEDGERASCDRPVSDYQNFIFKYHDLFFLRP
jgi:hypothetical protein